MTTAAGRPIDIRSTRTSTSTHVGGLACYSYLAIEHMTLTSEVRICWDPSFTGAAAAPLFPAETFHPRPIKARFDVRTQNNRLFSAFPAESTRHESRFDCDGSASASTAESVYSVAGKVDTPQTATVSGCQRLQQTFRRLIDHPAQRSSIES